MKRAALILCAVWALAAERHPATAIVLKIDRAHRSFEASCQEIPGYMAAMVMPFSVREEKELDGLAPGTAVDFTLVAGKSRSYAEAIRVHKGVEIDRKHVLLPEHIKEVGSFDVTVELFTGVATVVTVEVTAAS